ncbi:MAG: hypothetical protein EBU93_00140 [Chlamydiae bacterium]|nr:hypothetical protein [Chlamydiota bacterium]
MIMAKIQINQLTVGLNTPFFSKVFSDEKTFLTPKGHPLSYELVLAPGMEGSIIEEYGECFKIEFSFYPQPVFVLKEHVNEKKKATETASFTKEEIQKRLVSCLGKPYLWGGNDRYKTDAFDKKFQINFLRVREKRAAQLDGLDCSGLLFYATGYRTKRNTHELESSGTLVESIEEIIPLDIILTKGHVRIVLDENQVIQSRQNRGVYLSKVKDELFRLIKNKIPFSVRRVL